MEEQTTVLSDSSSNADENSSKSKKLESKKLLAHSDSIALDNCPSVQGLAFSEESQAGDSFVCVSSSENLDSVLSKDRTSSASFPSSDVSYQKKDRPEDLSVRSSFSMKNVLPSQNSKINTTTRPHLGSQNKHTGEKTGRAPSFFSGRDKKPSFFSRSKTKQAEPPVVSHSTQLPPGFGKESFGKSSIPEWVQELDHSRAHLGPTGKHVKDMAPPPPPPPPPPAAPVSSPSFSPTKTTPSYFSSRGRSSFGAPPPKTDRSVTFGDGISREKSLFSKRPASESDSSALGKSKPAGFSPGFSPAFGKEGASRDNRGGGFRGNSTYSKPAGRSDSGRKGHSFRSGQEHSSQSRRSFSHKKSNVDAPPVIPEHLKISLPISVATLAASMKIRTAQLVSKMFMQGTVLRSNDVLEQETLIKIIGNEFNCLIEVNSQALERGKVFRKTILEELEQTDPQNLIARPPVIALIGHVDHGKTSLIDAIRRSDLARHEPGEITQHIGAFSVPAPDGSSITILDTPGHEAFSAMRDRGVRIADVVVLVIAGDEGIKAQTEEAIRVIKETESSMVVALTKADKPNFDQDRIMRQLAERDLLPEAWGGSIVTAVCSSSQGTGVSDLLEILQLQASLLQLKADPKARARGVVIESRVDLGLGPSATILIQNGTLSQGNIVVAGSAFGKVRTIKNDRNKLLKQTSAGFAASISGLSSPPAVGEPFVVVSNEQEARWATELYLKSQISFRSSMISPEVFIAKGLGIRKRTLYVVFCGDVHGSVEALTQALQKIPSERVDIEIVYQTVGIIGESLVSLASAAKAIIIGFQTTIDLRAQILAKNLGISVYIFQIIYRAVEKVTELMQGLLDKISQEKFSGIAEIRAIFKSSKFGVIAGCGVINGIVKRSQIVRVMREGKLLHSGKIMSMRTGRDDLKESSKGFECGIIVEHFTDFRIGDELHAFDIIYLSQGLLECDDEKQD